MAAALHSLIIDAGLEPERWPVTLAAISARFRDATIMVNHEMTATIGSGEVWTHRLDPSVYHDVPDEMWTPSANAGVAHMFMAPVGAAVDRRSFFADSMLDRDPFTRHFIVDSGMFHMTLSTVQRDATTMSAVILAQPRQAEPLSPMEQRRAQQLFAQMGQAMRAHRALRRSEARGLGLAAALDRLPQGVVLAQGDLRVLHVNRAAEAIVEAGDGILLRFGRLRLAHARLDALLQDTARRLAHSSPDVGERSLMVPRPSRHADYRIAVLPVLGDAIATLAPRAQIMVMISNPESALMPDQLRRAYPLTPAEARVASLAAQALPLAEIARRSSVSVNTVKSQLRTIYGKLDVRNQTELVALLATRLVR